MNRPSPTRRSTSTPLCRGPLGPWPAPPRTTLSLAQPLLQERIDAGLAGAVATCELCLEGVEDVVDGPSRRREAALEVGERVAREGELLGVVVGQVADGARAEDAVEIGDEL